MNYNELEKLNYPKPNYELDEQDILRLGRPHTEAIKAYLQEVERLQRESFEKAMRKYNEPFTVGGNESKVRNDRLRTCALGGCSATMLYREGMAYLGHFLPIAAETHHLDVSIALQEGWESAVLFHPKRQPLAKIKSMLQRRVAKVKVVDYLCQVEGLEINVERGEWHASGYGWQKF